MALNIAVLLNLLGFKRLLISSGDILSDFVYSSQRVKNKIYNDTGKYHFYYLISLSLLQTKLLLNFIMCEHIRKGDVDIDSQKPSILNMITSDLIKVIKLTRQTTIEKHIILCFQNRTTIKALRTVIRDHKGAVITGHSSISQRANFIGGQINERRSFPRKICPSVWEWNAAIVAGEKRRAPNRFQGSY